MNQVTSSMSSPGGGGRNPANLVSYQCVKQDSAASRAASLEAVHKRFDGGAAALDGVTFSVAEGEVLVLLGTSGSGKTTALKTINRLVAPDEGRVVVLGQDVREWDPIALRRRIGYVIQDVGLLPHLSVQDNVELVPRLVGWSPERRAARARELLSLTGLDPDHFLPKKPRQLSGGERQRDRKSVV